MVMDRFSPAVRAWFTTTFPEPTRAQALGWPAIADGEHTLILAPTGSGKTLTAFLWGLDRLMSTPPPEGPPRTRLLYISPLRALAVDVEKNLRSPLAGIALAGERLGVPVRVPTVAIRTGDTPARERQQMARKPPELLITTPESLYLLLTSNAGASLAGVEAVIIDEIHALAPTKRGAHLALSLERLAEITERPPQRIGLSATQRPLEEIARFLGGFDDDRRPRPVQIIDAGVSKPLELTVRIPVEDMSDLGAISPEPASGPAAGGPARNSIWPAVHPAILDEVMEHRSTIIFANARRLTERLAGRLNELAADRELVPEGHELVKAHHGSLSREQRLVIEDQLKRGELKALVATSSLELGIDMGAVDLVIQVESPGAVSRGLQRIGRAGHQVGSPSRGTIFPKHRGDLVETAVVVRRMRDGLIEHTRYLRNPLDVLAQQIVALCAARPAGTDLAVEDVSRLVRRAAPFAELSDDVLAAVLDLLAGRYPSEEFAELRPRLVWDRVAGTLRARDGARRLAVTNGGTIPDRGLFGVFLPDGTRVGELDEEMVYESRPGETFVLGASTWRIEDITFERVVVSPAPGQPGKMPFWHGDRPGRPLELGLALGAFVREIRAMPHEAAHARLRAEHDLDEWAADNLLRYLDDQAAATGAVPDDRTVVIERFRDEIGDWRVCILTPFGTPVNAPWAMAIESRLAARYDAPVEIMWSDDGIVLRLPEAADQLDLDDVLVAPEDLDELVLAKVASTSLFAARFRECAARALLLPKRRPDRRTPLWQQRQRAGDLLAVASKYPSFPILLETSREVIQDVFDVPALRDVLGRLRSRQMRVVQVETASASPFAQSLLFAWIAAYMYEGDAPLAERRAAALALDRSLLAELLGAEELRELLDPEALADLELELQHLTDGRRARNLDELHDLLVRLGDLTTAEADVRCDGDGAAWLETLGSERRAIQVAVAGQQRWIAAQDAAMYRDALGAALPVGLPAEFTMGVPRPTVSMVGRYARTHTPFVAVEVSSRLGLPVERVNEALATLELDERVVHGAFRPGGREREWCDTEVLRTLRRRSLARLRAEVEPVDTAAFARFLPAWQQVGSTRGGLDALVEVVGQLQGAALCASTLDTMVLPSRVARYSPADLDALCTSGELVWIGAGGIGGNDGRLRLYFRDQAAVLAPAPTEPPGSALADALLEHLTQRGASFWPQLMAVAPTASEAELLAALWDLVWGGWVTNDSLAPVRAYVAGKVGKVTSARPAGRPRPGRLTRLGPPSAAGRWSLTSELLAPRPTDTARQHALATQLLERHGVLTREAVLAEGIDGGFSAVYPVLKVLEERGVVRRGYFVAGLGAAQFALPGAVERLRGEREAPDAAAPVVLSATDPAQPWGSALAWPEHSGRAARVPTAVVVARAGEPLVWFDRSAHHLVTFPAAAQDTTWAGALAALADQTRRGSVEVRRIDGSDLADQSAIGALKEAGFVQGYKALVKR